MTPPVFTPRRLARLFVSDALNVSRDATLLFVFVLSALPAAALYAGRGALDRWAEASVGLAHAALYLEPVVLVMPGILIGWVVGFLMLEDRDDGPLLAVDVTPVGKEGLLAYRLVAAGAMCLAITLIATPAVVPGAGPGVTLAMAAAVAMEAAIVAIVLPALARNKVEGLALTKVLNLAALVPLVAALPSGWRFVAAPVPTFWLGELVGLSGRTGLGVPLTALAMLVVHGIVLVLIYRRFAGRKG